MPCGKKVADIETAEGDFAEQVPREMHRRRTKGRGALKKAGRRPGEGRQ